MENKSVIIANITYNSTGWQDISINPHAGHSYARSHPGHEALNFKFDKKDLDTDKYVYGFVHWTNAPVKYKDGGIILFYSRNIKKKYSEIVGIYCDTQIIREPIFTHYKGFQNDQLISNIKGNIDLSLLFPIPLEAWRYTKGRLVGQNGFKYSNLEFAERIIVDEIEELKKSGMKASEYHKLNNIYRFITGNDYLTENNEAINEFEQNEILEIIKSEPMDAMIDELEDLKPTDPEQIEIKQKAYKRDNKTIAQLKIIRDFKCQMCGVRIQKKNGDYYIEAAHIQPKNKKGTETPDNILILCPNHHKEFDLGKCDIVTHSKEFIEFNLNGRSYKIDLNLKNALDELNKD